MRYPPQRFLQEVDARTGVGYRSCHEAAIAWDRFPSSGVAWACIVPCISGSTGVTSLNCLSEQRRPDYENKCR